MKNWYVIILAGGKGERLWPLSRKRLPKQLLKIHNKTLLEQTLDRVEGLVPDDHIYIVTTKDQEHLVCQAVEKYTGVTILCEPEGRNTAAAVALATAHIKQKDDDAILCFLPADHMIKEKEVFREALYETCIFAQEHDNICLLGVQPTRPATGFGYIEYVQSASESLHKVVKFHEKPSEQLASFYVSVPTMLWNIGVFCGKTSAFLNAFLATAPHILTQVNASLRDSIAYSECEHISFDHAVLEKYIHTYVRPVSMTWSDMGTLESFLSFDHDEQVRSNVIALQSHNNIVRVSNKLVVLIDVHDVCIIEMDDVVFVAHRNQTEQVKHVVATLKSKKFEEYL